MAKFQADITFEGIEEKKVFKQGEKFEMTVERSNELQKNIKEKYNIDKVMTRLDDPKTDDGQKEETAKDKQEEKKETKK